MPNREASKILSRYGDKNTIPVDLFAIASNMGIVVTADPENSEISGHYQPEGFNGRPLITFNPNEHPVRQRFTIAHELGHHALKHGARDRDTPKNFSTGVSDNFEQAANAFAAELLMPKDAVDSLIKVRGIRSLSELAALFKVSKPAMTFRLRNLGYAVT